MNLLTSPPRTARLLLAAAALLGAASLSAAPIPKLFSTGVNDAGAPLANSTKDPHYTLVESADEGFQGPDLFTLNGGFPVPPWIAEGPSSRWIAPRPQQGTGNNEGQYIYRTKFDLTGFDPNKAKITGKWAVDNSGADIVLNGVSLGLANTAGFGAFTDFAIESGFVAGENVLDFVVVNAPSGVNPTGLRVELRGTVEVPDEPPRFLDHPTAQTLIVGDPLSLTVSVDGTPPFTYQWKRNGQAIQGATEATYSVQAVGDVDDGEYIVEVTNGVGTRPSNAARVNVLQRIPGLYGTGLDAAGAAKADGEPDTHYRLVANADGDPMDPLVQDSTVFPIVGGPWLANSDTSKWIGPRFETSGAAGGDYTYEVTVNLEGLDPTTAFITGDWATDNEGTLLLNGEPTGIRNTAGFGGYTRFTLNAGFLTGVNKLQFRVNNAGAGYTGLRVDALRGGARKQTGPPVQVPRIVTQPTGGLYLTGENISLRVVADSAVPMTFQWTRNGEVVPNGTQATLDLGTVTLNSAGSYAVRINNSAGNTNSEPAVVTVLERVPGVFNTGVSGTGVALDDGLVDPNYMLSTNATDTASADAIVHDSTIFPIVAGPWVANSASSKWVGPKLNTVDALAGDYAFVTKFDLTGFDPATAVLMGTWATDNLGTDIRLNGNSTGLQNGNQFTILTPFSISSGFVAGVNTLEFLVNNAADGFTALRVDNLRVGALRGTAAAPSVSVAATPTGVRISWPRSAAGFRLVQTTALGGVWADVNAPVVEVGDQNTVSLNASGDVLLFRLQK